MDFLLVAIQVVNFCIVLLWISIPLLHGSIKS